MRITRQHPRFEEIRELWESYARAKNTQVWFNLKDIPVEFVLSLQDDLRKKMEEFLEDDSKNFSD